MESESDTPQIKITDSAYSNSFSNSNSQRSASSKSRLSGSNSSRSSGYCGGGVNSVNGSVDTSEALNKRNKDKKKKLKSTNSNINAVINSSSNTTSENRSTTFANEISSITMGLEILPIHSIKLQETSSQKLESCNNSTAVTALPTSIPVIEESSCCGDNLTMGINEERKENVNLTVDVPAIEDVFYLNGNDPLESLNKINSYQPEDGFCCVISMYDGVVLYTTPSVTNALGFPMDMWLGRSFTDFVHPKDRDTFSTEITTGVAIPLIDAMGKKSDVKSSLYVCLRRYRGLRTSGFGVVESSVCYQPFHISVTFRHVTESIDSIFWDNNRDAFLIIVAMPLYSPYKVPDEVKESKIFGTRHTASCIFSHVDAEVAMNFGYFPQDMVGKSVFDFYHPDDLPLIKEIYKSIISNCQIAGSVYKSKPYRFAVQNGHFAIIETEWSCFINPWSRRLEFVVGLHRVLQGPSNPDVFKSPKNNQTNPISEDVLKEARLVQEEIALLLNQELLRPSEIVKNDVCQRRKNLAAFVETIFAEVSKTDVKVDSPQNHNVSISENESVMLGEISPHHDYYDRDSSSETPPSYNQLNYHENIQRFFKSRPMTTVTDDNGGKRNMAQNVTEKEEGKILSIVGNQKCLSPVQISGASGSGSAGNLSSENIPIIESATTSPANASNDSFKPPHLTEKLLIRHNEDMEKIMRQRHREHRSSIKVDREGKKTLHKNGPFDKNEVPNANHAHGVKRSGSYSWEEDNHKVPKHKHQNGFLNCYDDPNTTRNTGGFKHNPPSNIGHHGINANDSAGFLANDVNLWPPFSVSMAHLNSAPVCGRNCLSSPNGSFPTGMLPIYYIPAQQTNAMLQHTENHSATSFPVQYMPSMMLNCNAAFPAPPVFCSPMAVLPFPLSQPIQPVMPDERLKTNTATFKPNTFSPATKCQGIASRVASVKAEPGNAIDSASVLHRPKKVTEEKSVLDARQDEESSYSSLYSSLLKTDIGSGSNDDSNATDSKNKSDDNSLYKKPRPYTMRKCDPPWMETVSVTPELVYRYQMTVKNLEDILQADLRSLKNVDQPVLVNDQLDQLYVELELNGLSTKLTLEDSVSSRGCSGEEGSCMDVNKRNKDKLSYSSLMMIYEEDAPFPPAEV